jgi:hypothetical protein
MNLLKLILSLLIINQLNLIASLRLLNKKFKAGFKIGLLLFAKLYDCININTNEVYYEFIN